MQLSTWKNLYRLTQTFKLEDLAHICQENSKSINIISTLHENLCMGTLVTEVTTVATVTRVTNACIIVIFNSVTKVIVTNVN